MVTTGVAMVSITNLVWLFCDEAEGTLEKHTRVYDGLPVATTDV